MVKRTVCLCVVAIMAAVVPAQIMAQAPPRDFGKAKVMVQDGEKTKEQDAVVRFASQAFEVQQKGMAGPLKAFPYSAITSAEYSYSKTVRWVSGLLLSPLLFLSSGKKHWLLVKTADDYAMLVLDKGNYKVVLAELETRAKLKVAVLSDSK